MVGIAPVVNVHECGILILQSGLGSDSVLAVVKG